MGKAQNLSFSYPLSDLQHVYLIGREAGFSGQAKSSQLYVEFLLRACEISQVSAAWTYIVSEYVASRLVLNSDLEVSAFPHDVVSPTVYDVSLKTCSDIDGHLASIREEMGYSTKSLYVEDLWDCRLTTHGNGALTLHMSFDIFFIDIQSVYFLISRFFNVLCERDSGISQPKPDYSKYLHYRRCKLTSMAPETIPFEDYPSGPQFLPEYRSDEGRFCLSMTCDFYEALVTKARELSCQVNSLLLFFLCRALAPYLEHQAFTIVVVKMLRKRFDFNHREGVGEFSTLSYFSFKGGSSLSLEEEISELDKWLSYEMSLVPYDRLSEFKVYQKGAPSSFSFVYTCLPDNADIQLPTGSEFVLCKAQTPHVNWDQFCSIIDNKLFIHWDIESGYCSKSTAQSIQKDYIQCLKAFSFSQPIPASPTFGIEEKEAPKQDSEATLLSGFMKVMMSFSDRPAIVCGSDLMSYQDLDSTSNQCARWLSSLGVQKGSRVGFCLPSSVDILSLLFGILKCGAIFVPLDVETPNKRKIAIVKDLELQVFIDGVSAPELEGSVHTVILQKAKRLASCWLTMAAGVFGVSCDPDDVAYIIMTSGSTGEPKGVELSHASVMTTLHDIQHRFQLVETDAILNVSSLGFDLSIFDIFGVLSVGGKVVFPEASQRLNPSYWVDVIDREAITLWNSVPSLMSLLCGQASKAQLSTLRLCLLSGDWIPIELASVLRRDYPRMELVSLGGATEVSIWSIYYPIDKVSSSWSSIPYGRPLSNQILCVVNDDGECCDNGEIGELYIGGDGVAEGYVNRLELTATKFITATLSGYAGRFYKTGDLVSCDESGLFWIHGRKDNQIKLNGLRIECGDIECQVNRFSESVQSIIVLKGDHLSEKSLTCFYTAPKCLDHDQLRCYLKDHLPAYMVPNHVIYLTSLPLTDNHKVDRRQLIEWASYQGIIDVISLRSACDKWPLLPDLYSLLWPMVLTQIGGQYRGQYPSAGSYYPIKIYLYIAEDMSPELKKGLYYFEQKQRTLFYCGVYPELASSGKNKADCSLFFVGDDVHIRAQYGDLADHFMRIEVGSLFELLRSQKEGYSLEESSVHCSQLFRSVCRNGEVLMRLDCCLKSSLEEVCVRESHQSSLDLAIVGMSGRFAQNQSIYSLWRFLSKGQSAVSEVPEDRPWFGDKIGLKGTFLSGVDLFDAALFKYSSAEATFMDPQERHFLECVWETLEDAGYTNMELNQISDEGVGVFVGVSYSDYQRWGKGVGPSSIPLSSGIGHIANRASHYFQFSGPSVAIDSLCSSSIVALDTAVKAIRAGDCSSAIVGGCNLTLQDTKYHVLNRYDMVSSSGQCHSFNAHGDGFVPGEGVGSILIKPIAQAKEDGDHIYAVIKGVSTSGTGYRRGYTMPNDDDQYRVMTRALSRSNLSSSDLDYVECHAPGTYLGDGSELKALHRLCEKRDNPLKLGSIKPNMGHLEAASGIVSFIKAVLQLHFKQFVPTIGVTAPHELLAGLSEQLSVVTAHSYWEKASQDHVRRCAVMSFGAGGTNGGVILEEDRSDPVLKYPQTSQLFVLSAMSWEQLIQYVKRVYCFIDMYKPSLENVCFTLQRGRQAMQVRLFIVADSLDSLMASLVQVQGLEPPVSLEYLGIAVSDPERSNDTVTSFESLAQLGEVWRHGASVDWSSCFPHGDQHRISLPTYPFAKTSFWPECVGI